MPIVQTLNFHQFRDAFREAGRTDQFSYKALEVIFDYLEEYSESTGEPYELDVVAICCDFYEDTWQDIAENYRIDLSDCEDDEERMEAVMDYVNDHSWILGTYDDKIVYECF